MSEQHCGSGTSADEAAITDDLSGRRQTSDTLLHTAIALARGAIAMLSGLDDFETREELTDISFLLWDIQDKLGDLYTSLDDEGAL
jgi:hypothetical protein